MSFHLENQHPQPKQAHIGVSDYTIGDLSHDDGVLISRVIPITLNLFETKSKQKRSLEEYHIGDQQTMNRRNGNNNNNMPKNKNLKVNYSSSRRTESPARSPSMSPPSSCLSSEKSTVDSSPESSSMVLVGCPRCLMYVMLSEDDPKCPKCKSTVLLDFQHHNNTNYSGNIGTSNNTRKS